MHTQAPAANDPTARIAALAEAAAPAAIALRRDLHAHPELAFAEHRTAATIAAALAGLGLAPRTSVGRTGIIADIAGGRPGPTLALRADMDALPIGERTGLAYASQTPGLMHACGHDLHSATLVAAAAILTELAPQLAGRVRLIFQPAEETLQGAAAMIADGALDGVDRAIGFHNQPDMPTGRFAHVPGATLAGADTIEIIITGRSGHAAYPHTAIDPIVAAATLITQLQTIVAREVPPTQAAVITIGRIEGGTAANIIPDEVRLLGTVRALSAPVRDLLEAAITRQVGALEATLRTPARLIYTRGCPPLVNDPTVAAATIAALTAQFGPHAVHQAAPGMGAEDFAFFAERVPACQFRIGSGAPGRADRLHNSDYQPDEAAIALGAQALARAALELLS